jgi:hypothetical protein
VPGRFHAETPQRGYNDVLLAAEKVCDATSRTIRPIRNGAHSRLLQPLLAHDPDGRGQNLFTNFVCIDSAGQSPLLILRQLCAGDLERG